MDPLFAFRRSSIVLAALVALAAGCKDKQPEPTKEPASSAQALGPRGKMPPRPPLGAMSRVDPQTMKEYRVDVCYYSTLSLKQARDAYLASTNGGKDEPSEKKLPNFGFPAPASATVDAGAPKPAGSAMPTPMPMPPRYDFSKNPPYERNARACTAAATLKEPAMGDVDAALQAYAPFANDLAKDIIAANNYYNKEDYKKDALAQGKTLHKKLLDEFAKLDELSNKLGSAIEAWHKDHKPDESKMDEGEKKVRATFEAARGLMTALAATPHNVAAFKDAEGQLAPKVEDLKSYAAANATDMWAKLTLPDFEKVQKAAKDLEPKLTDKTADPELELMLITQFNGLIEARQRAVTRAAMQKNNAANAASAAPSAAPAPEQK